MSNLPFFSSRFEQRRVRIGLAIGLVGTCIVHGAFVLATLAVVLLGRGSIVSAVRLPPHQELVFVDVQPAPVSPKPESPQPEPEEPLAVAPPVADPPTPLPTLAPAPAPVDKPSAAPSPEEVDSTELAETAETLTTENAEDTFSVLSGDGDRFAGGDSAADGTSRTAVRRRSHATAESPPPTVQKNPTLPAPPPPPITRWPFPKNGSWNQCRFPAAAKAKGLEDGRITLVVHVTEKGRPTSVDVLFETPNGYGFGEAAGRCAMRRRYHPARNAAGKRVAAATRPFKVRMLKNR